MTDRLLSLVEHFPEKWTPVFRKEMRQNNDSRARSWARPRRNVLNLIGTRSRHGRSPCRGDMRGADIDLRALDHAGTRILVNDEAARAGAAASCRVTPAWSKGCDAAACSWRCPLSGCAA